MQNQANRATERTPADRAGSELITHQIKNFSIFSYFPMIHINNFHFLGDRWNTNPLEFSDEKEIWRKIIKLWTVTKIVITLCLLYLEKLNFKLALTRKPLYQQSWLVWDISAWVICSRQMRVSGQEAQVKSLDYSDEFWWILLLKKNHSMSLSCLKFSSGFSLYLQ